MDVIPVRVFVETQLWKHNNVIVVASGSQENTVLVFVPHQVHSDISQLQKYNLVTLTNSYLILLLSNGHTLEYPRGKISLSTICMSLSVRNTHI